jgi:regulator of sigma E protease
MNILPIPGLDGGHALFTLAEMVTGRRPSDKFLEYAQMVGMVLLMGLMAYALGLDVWRIFS